MAVERPPAHHDALAPGGASVRRLIGGPRRHVEPDGEAGRVKVSLDTGAESGGDEYLGPTAIGQLPRQHQAGEPIGDSTAVFERARIVCSPRTSSDSRWAVQIVVLASPNSAHARGPEKRRRRRLAAGCLGSQTGQCRIVVEDSQRRSSSSANSASSGGTGEPARCRRPVASLSSVTFVASVRWFPGVDQDFEYAGINECSTGCDVIEKPHRRAHRVPPRVVSTLNVGSLRLPL